VGGCVGSLMEHLLGWKLGSPYQRYLVRCYDPQTQRRPRASVDIGKGIPYGEEDPYQGELRDDTCGVEAQRG